MHRRYRTRMRHTARNPVKLLHWLKRHETIRGSDEAIFSDLGKYPETGA
jgi:hypothetical protein